MTPAPSDFGQLSYDMAHLLEGAALLFSFVLLYQRRIEAVINTYTAQALTVAASCFWQAHVQQSEDLFATGIVTLLAKGIGFPWALHRIARQTKATGSVEMVFGVFPSLALGLFLACLALLVVMRIPAGAALTRETLATSLSVLLLGLAMMTTRTSALTQTIGFLSVENGLALAAVGVPGMPIVVELSVAFLVMIAFIVFGIFFFRIRAQFDSLELHHLDRITEAPE